MKKTILLTGGHAATTALATIEELEQRGSWDMHWIGTHKAVEGKDSKTLEARIFPKHGINFHHIITGRLQRKFTKHTIPSLIKIPIGFVQSPVLVLRIKPQLTLSFGGFAALPVVFWSKVFGVPVIIHEQTSAAGLSNKISSYFADTVAISRLESKKYFPSGKTVLTGNPITKGIRSVQKDKRSKQATILVMGGSRGSQVINSAFEPILKEVLVNHKVIHLTGELDYNKFNKVKRSLPKGLQSNYKVSPIIMPDKMPEIYQEADLVITRAGANTVSEIMAVGLPAIIIPIPWSRENEQEKNAISAVKRGLAIMINEKEATPKRLYGAIGKILDSWEKFSKGYDRDLAKLDSNAASNLVDLIEEHI